jgi:hypothetical protein
MTRMMAPPQPPVRIALDDSDGPNRVYFRLQQVLITLVTLLVTAWVCTFGWIPAIIALMIAKHVLVAVLVMGLGVDKPEIRGQKSEISGWTSDF